MEENIEFELFRSEERRLTKEELLMLPPLHFAYLGDAVYELLVRTMLMKERGSVHVLNRRAKQFVCAQAQAALLFRIEPHLTDEERNMVRRGRNAKIYSHPKNAAIMDYKNATGLEVLFGYLFLKGEDRRLRELFEHCTKKEDGDES